MIASYFIRHSGIDDQEELFSQKLIAIHFDLRSMVPADYPAGAGRSAMRRFNELATDGGYVWARYSNIKKDLVGFVKPGSQIELLGTSSLKVLRLKKTKEIKAGEQMNMRVAWPRQGTFSKWPIVSARLEGLVEGRKNEMGWELLDTPSQESVCAEFLRHSEDSDIQLHFLLLPVGRTMKDVDIYGMTHRGHRLFGQVTLTANPDTIRAKIAVLKEYEAADPNNKLVFFSPRAGHSIYAKLQNDQSKIKFIATETVFDWVRSNKILSNELFG